MGDKIDRKKYSVSISALCFARLFSLGALGKKKRKWTIYTRIFNNGKEEKKSRNHPFFCLARIAYCEITLANFRVVCLAKWVRLD